MSKKPEIPVLVTGFGPFGIHKVNISWEIAKVLQTLNFENQRINLITELIPVAYNVVSKQIPTLWKKYKPQLVLHMGVTSVGSEMSLEMFAHKTGYVKADIFGKLPEKGSAQGEKDVIRTELDIQSVSDFLNNSTHFDVPIKVSTNAGRYLCEFTYYNSLNLDNSRVVFLHVPDFDKGFAVKEMAIVVKQIILMLLEQVNKSFDERSERVTEADEMAQK